MLCLSKQENADAEDERDSVLLQVSATGPGPYSSSCTIAPTCSKIFQSFEEESDKSVFERDSVLYKQV